MTKWRTKTYQLKLSRNTRLSFSLRRFRTAKHRRSKTYRQLVIQTDIYRIREIAIRFERKTKKHILHKRPSLHLPKLQPALPTVLALAGALGTASIFGYVLVSAQTSPPKSITNFASTTPVAQTPKSTEPVSKPVGLPASVPTRLSVPSVGIESNIISLGLAADGSMETPPVFGSDVGWYRLGPTPGEVGPAIIVGHLDTYEGPSVFWRLREVQAGSLIHINRTDGKVATFKVTNVTQYSQDNFPTEAVYGNLTFPGLRLITCGGTFNQETQRYSENTVVYAELVAE